MGRGRGRRSARAKRDGVKEIFSCTGVEERGLFEYVRYRYAP